jgi:hypothetical protein
MISVSPQVAWVDRGERVWLLDLSSASPLPVELAGTGAEIWRLLPATFADLRGAVEASYGVGVEGDVAAFVESLIEAGFVTSNGSD